MQTSRRVFFLSLLLLLFIPYIWHASGAVDVYVVTLHNQTPLRSILQKKIPQTRCRLVSFMCIQCGILTPNEFSFLMRRDYEQITINCCKVCRSKLSNKWIYSINEIHFTPHKIIRIARLR